MSLGLTLGVWVFLILDRLAMSCRSRLPLVQLPVPRRAFFISIIDGLVDSQIRALQNTNESCWIRLTPFPPVTSLAAFVDYLDESWRGLYSYCFVYQHGKDDSDRWYRYREYQPCNSARGLSFADACYG